MKDFCINILLSVILVSCAFGIVGLYNYTKNHKPTYIDVRYVSEIKGYDENQGVAKILQEAKSNDVIRFHIAGYGGEVDTVYYLIDNIKQSKAKVIMIVEAPSYSGHAYLATQGSKLVMAPYSLLMFHIDSAYNIDCSQPIVKNPEDKEDTGYDPKGKDRGITNQESCQNLKDQKLIMINKLINNISFLTQKEKQDIEQGKEVYITADEYNKRVRQ